MIQVFRKNWLVFTLLLYPYALVTRIWAFFETPAWPYDVSQESFVYKYFEQFFPENYIWNVVLATLFIFINAAQINNIVIKNRITREINLFPGMAFILFSALHKDMFWLSPQLISITFLLAAISNLFRIYQRPKAERFIFNAGLFTGLATIFYFPYSLFIVFCAISIFVLRKFSIRDMIQLLSGYFMVFFILVFVLYWNDQALDLSTSLFSSFSWKLSYRPFMINEWIIFILLFLLIFLSGSNYRKFTIKKSIQSQKKVNLIYWLMITALITLPFTSIQLLFPSLMVIFISYAVFTGMFMTRTKNEAALELLHLFLLFFIIFSHFRF